MKIIILEDKNLQRYFDLFKNRDTGKMDIRYFPAVINGIQRSTNYVKREWIQLLNNQTEKKGWCREYAATIASELRDQGMTGFVYADDKNMYVKFVEKGIPRFDMKNPPNGKGLLNSPRTRVGKKGRYNIVPFRHGAPGAQHITNMPIAVYEKAKNLDRGEIAKRYRTIGIGGSIATQGGIVKKRVHSKASRLKGKKGRSIYEGLIKTGSAKHTSYVTFRVISQHSTGWIYPGSKPMNIYDTIEKKVQPVVKKILSESLKADAVGALKFIGKG